MPTTMYLSYPFTIAQDGLIATTTEEKHIEQMIEQLLFTVPGERVNRPDFGTEIGRLVFSPGNSELTTAAQFLIQGALQQWLGMLIQVQAVQVTTDDSTLSVTIQYQIKRTQQVYVAQFSR